MPRSPGTKMLLRSSVKKPDSSSKMPDAARNADYKKPGAAARERVVIGMLDSPAIDVHESASDEVRSSSIVSATKVHSSVTEIPDASSNDDSSSEMFDFNSDDEMLDSSSDEMPYFDSDDEMPDPAAKMMVVVEEIKASKPPAKKRKSPAQRRRAPAGEPRSQARTYAPAVPVRHAAARKIAVVKIKNPASYDEPMPSEPRIFETGRPTNFQAFHKTKETLLCVSTASPPLPLPRRDADRTGQCRGHRTADINAAVCGYRDARRETACTHARCVRCCVKFEGCFNVAFVIAYATKVFLVGRYPGAQVLQKKLESGWNRAYKSL